MSDQQKSITTTPAGPAQDTNGLMAPGLATADHTAGHKKLEEMEERMRLAIEAARIGMYDKDFISNRVVCTPRLLEIMGLTKPIITLEELRETIHPDDRHIRDEAHRQALTTGTISYEARVVWPDGTVYWIQARGKVFFNEQREPLRILGTVSDITERKLLTDQLEKEVQQRTRELQESNDALVKSNEELEQFAYVASHDLQEPLRKIQTFVNRLLESKESVLSPADQDIFRRIQASSSRMNQLIVDLLSYSTVNTSGRLFAVTDLNALLKNVEEQLKESIEQAGAVITALPLPSINIIPYQFEQLLTNLISNSLKFSRAGVQPRIIIDAALVRGKEITGLTAAKSKMYHRITVADNGIGFDEQYSERIFQVFQRLHGKHEYPGTGIGLAICKKIVENHHGFINASGVEGKGALFSIYIPG